MNPESVLLADPDIDSRSLYADAFMAEGWTCLEASDGPEALALALTRAPSLCIAELWLPKIDGLALCEELRKDVHTQRVPFCGVSDRAAERWDTLQCETCQTRYEDRLRTGTLRPAHDSDRDAAMISADKQRSDARRLALGIRARGNHPRPEEFIVHLDDDEVFVSTLGMRNFARELTVLPRDLGH